MVEGQLVAYALLAFAERGDPPTDCRHMLADAKVDPLDERGVDLPAR
jgi:hypothetical protein